MSDQFAYRLESTKSFGEVTSNIETQSAEHMFRVLAVHDVQETLAEKGFERGPLKIIEVCNAGFAHTALGKEIHVSLFMPCRFSVFEEGDKTVVILARPTMISQMMPQAGIDDLAADVEGTLKKIMAASI